MRSTMKPAVVVLTAAVLSAGAPLTAHAATTGPSGHVAVTEAAFGASSQARVADSAASAAAPKKIPGRYCGQARGSGGYVRQAAPWKSGKYIYASSIASCGKADIWNFRAVESHLSQYRGLGIWRVKARKITRKNGRAAYTVTHNLSWKCSGGSQLYRTLTANRVGKWAYKSYSGQRRIRC